MRGGPVIQTAITSQRQYHAPIQPPSSTMETLRPVSPTARRRDGHGAGGGAEASVNPRTRVPRPACAALSDRSDGRTATLVRWREPRGIYEARGFGGKITHRLARPRRNCNAGCPCRSRPGRLSDREGARGIDIARSSGIAAQSWQKPGGQLDRGQGADPARAAPTARPQRSMRQSGVRDMSAGCDARVSCRQAARQRKRRAFQTHPPRQPLDRYGDGPRYPKEPAG